MSRMANMSIMALYGWDNTLFDLLTLPTGLSKADQIMYYPNHKGP